MTVYVIAQLKFKNRELYDCYQAAFAEVFAYFNGQLLAADEHPKQLEGTWQASKLVLIAFPDEPSYRRWADSPGYQEISKHRKAGADAVVLLVRGIDEYRK